MEEHPLKFFLSLNLQTTITFDLELRLPHRLRPRVHRGELYKTHTINLEVSHVLLFEIPALFSSFMSKNVEILGSLML